MTIDELMDKIDENPAKWITLIWSAGLVLSLIGMVVAILIIVGLLHLIGLA